MYLWLYHNVPKKIYCIFAASQSIIALCKFIFCLIFVVFSMAYIIENLSRLIAVRDKFLCPTMYNPLFRSQCCGSGSGSTGSTCFWASWIRIHQSALWIRIRILLLSCKNRKKNHDSIYLLTLLDFLSLKNDVNVASKSNIQKKLC